MMLGDLLGEEEEGEGEVETENRAVVSMRV